VALRLFREKGIRRPRRWEEIAAAAEYSPSTFLPGTSGSKEDVVFLNIRQDLEEFRQALNDPPGRGVSVWGAHPPTHLPHHRPVSASSGPEFEATSIAIWLTDPALWAAVSSGFCARLGSRSSPRAWAGPRTGSTRHRLRPRRPVDRPQRRRLMPGRVPRPREHRRRTCRNF